MLIIESFHYAAVSVLVLCFNYECIQLCVVSCVLCFVLLSVLCLYCCLLCLSVTSNNTVFQLGLAMCKII